MYSIVADGARVMRVYGEPTDIEPVMDRWCKWFRITRMTAEVLDEDLVCDCVAGFTRLQGFTQLQHQVLGFKRVGWYTYVCDGTQTSVFIEELPPDD